MPTTSMTLLLSLILCGVSFVLLLYSLRKSFLLRSVEKQLMFLAQKHDELSIRVDDLVSKLNTGITNVTKQSHIIEKRMSLFEERLEKGGSGPKFELETGSEAMDRAKEEAQKKDAQAKALSKAQEREKSDKAEVAKPTPEKKPDFPIIPARPLPTVFQNLRSALQSSVDLILQKDVVSERRVFDDLSLLLHEHGLGVLVSSDLQERIRQAFTEEASTAANALSGPSILRILSDSSFETLTHLCGAPASVPLDVRATQVVLFVGAPGMGRSTAVLGVAYSLLAQGKKVVMADCVTAQDGQFPTLTHLARKARLPVLNGAPGAKPQSIAYRAIHQGQDDQAYVLIDAPTGLDRKARVTADLANVAMMIAREQPHPPHETLLVLDSQSVETARASAKAFLKEGACSGLFASKVDTTARAGTFLALATEFSLPLWFIGSSGSGREAHPARPRELATALFGVEPTKPADERKRGDTSESQPAPA